MEKSESIKLLSTALVGFHKAVGKVRKGETNPFFKSKYASLSNILDVIAEPLTANGLSVVQIPEGDNQLTTMLLHESGEYIAATSTMKPLKNDPQALGSAMTYQRRYAIGALLNINIDEDDDGAKASAPPKEVDPTSKIKAAKTEAELKAIYKSLNATQRLNQTIIQLLKDRKNEIII